MTIMRMIIALNKLNKFAKKLRHLHNNKLILILYIISRLNSFEEDNQEKEKTSERG